MKLKLSRQFWSRISGLLSIADGVLMVLTAKDWGLELKFILWDLRRKR